MSETHDDLMEAAIRAVDAAREDMLLAKASENTYLLRKVAISVVHGALLAERQRCAKIAEGDAVGFDFQQALADGDDLNVGANSARLGIAQEIFPGYALPLHRGDLNHD